MAVWYGVGRGHYGTVLACVRCRIGHSQLCLTFTLHVCLCALLTEWCVLGHAKNSVACLLSNYAVVGDVAVVLAKKNKATIFVKALDGVHVKKKSRAISCIGCKQVKNVFFFLMF